LYESGEDDSIDLFDNFCVLLENDIVLSRIDKIKLTRDEISVDLTLALRMLLTANAAKLFRFNCSVAPTVGIKNCDRKVPSMNQHFEYLGPNRILCP
jgi:hypothetical protein